MRAFEVGDKIVVRECPTFPHLKGRTGIVKAVRGRECYVFFRKTVKREEETVWIPKEQLQQ